MKGISLKRDIMTTSYACTCSSDTTRLLVALGANIRATDKNKDTPLHHAAANLNYGATKVLIDAGAPIEAKNNDVRQCMCVLQCVAKQCQIHAHTLSQGKTPYDLAMENQNVYDMDQLLMARQKRSPQGVLEYFTRDPVSVPFVCVFNVHMLVCMLKHKPMRPLLCINNYDRGIVCHYLVYISVLHSMCLLKISAYSTLLQTFCWWLMMFFSILVLGVIGWLGVYCPNWWSYFIASTLLGAVVRKFLM